MFRGTTLVMAILPSLIIIYVLIHSSVQWITLVHSQQLVRLCIVDTHLLGYALELNFDYIKKV